MANDKTEKASPQRRKKAREKGQVARSRELGSTVSLAAVTATLLILAPHTLGTWNALYREVLFMASSSNLDTNGPLIYWSTITVLWWVLPVLVVGFVASAAAGIAQGGFNLAPATLTPNFERFSPASKLKQIFSPMSLANLGKSLLPFAVILWIAQGILRENWPNILSTFNMSVTGLAHLVGVMLYELGWKAVLVLLVWCVVDYIFVWRKQENDMKMSKQELKEEFKDSEGNPVIKQRVRNIQRAMRRAQSLKAAATATVVITNPTHYAIAMRYEQDMPAPIVVAKGMDLIAQQIKEIARDAGIMMVENRPLAQALYKAVEVGDSIPSQLYQAVAEILVSVYKAQAEVRQREAERRNRNASGQPGAGPQRPAQPGPQSGAQPNSAGAR
jgi:flagellar biosynthetic protein FlhB